MKQFTCKSELTEEELIVKYQMEIADLRAAIAQAKEGKGRASRSFTGSIVMWSLIFIVIFILAHV